MDRDRTRGGSQYRGAGNNRQYFVRRDFYRTDGNNNIQFKPQMGIWKGLRKRLEAFQSEKSECLRDFQKREEEAMKSHNTRYFDLLNSERESIREKANDRESLKIKEDEFKTDRKEKLALVEQLKKCDKNSNDLKIAEIMKELADKEEELMLEKDRILESFVDLESQFTTQEKKLTKEIFEERENLNREKLELMERFESRDNNLNEDMQRFCLEIERQTTELNKMRNRYNRDPIMMRNSILEQDVLQRDQILKRLHSYIGDLEARNQIQLEQIQRLDADWYFEKAQLIQQLENDKAAIITKAKSDGIMEYVSGEWQHFEIHQASHHDPQSHNPTLFDFPYITQDALENGQSPCFQPLKQSNGTILTDLRDRYEDIKMKASVENNGDKFSWTLSMIRKIVSYYESIGMRVYEESSSNKFTSKFMWCPNDHLYPNKLEASFAMGHGDSKEEATENAAQLAFFNLQFIEANGTVTTANPEFIADDLKQPYEPIPSIATANQDNICDPSETVDIQSETDTIKSVTAVPEL